MKIVDLTWEKRLSFRVSFSHTSENKKRRVEKGSLIALYVREKKREIGLNLDRP
jgi:hypothetical protein